MLKVHSHGIFSMLSTDLSTVLKKSPLDNVRLSLFTGWKLKWKPKQKHVISRFSGGLVVMFRVAFCFFIHKSKDPCQTAVHTYVGYEEILTGGKVAEMRRKCQEVGCLTEKHGKRKNTKKGR